MNPDTDRLEPDQPVDFGPPLQRYLAGDAQALNDLPASERALAEQLAPTLKSARHVPATEVAASPSRDRRHDPIAVALGLVPGPADVLAAEQFKTARLRSGLNIKDVAQRLTDRGWNIATNQVLRWQHGDTEVMPALLQAIAETLGTSPSALRARPRVDQSASLDTWLSDEVIAAFLADWARESGVSADHVRDRARRTLASANYRNQGDATRDDVLTVLHALRRLRVNPPEPS